MQMEGKRSYEHGVRSRHSPKTGWKELLCREVFAGHGKTTCSTSVRKTGCPPPAPTCPGGRASPTTGSPDGGPARGTPVEVALPRVHARPP